MSIHDRITVQVGRIDSVLADRDQLFREGFNRVFTEDEQREIGVVFGRDRRNDFARFTIGAVTLTVRPENAQNARPGESEAKLLTFVVETEIVFPDGEQVIREERGVRWQFLATHIVEEVADAEVKSRYPRP